MDEKVFRCKVIMTTEFEIYQCKTLAEAEKRGNDMAIDLVNCMVYGDDINIECVEVSE